MQGEQLLFLRFMAKHMQPSCSATWLLERDDCAAQVCGLQLACRQLAHWQHPVRGMGSGKWQGLKVIVYAITIRDG